MNSALRDPWQRGDASASATSSRPCRTLHRTVARRPVLELAALLLARGFLAHLIGDVVQHAGAEPLFRAVRANGKVAVLRDPGGEALLRALGGRLEERGAQRRIDMREPLEQRPADQLIAGHTFQAGPRLVRVRVHDIVPHRPKHDIRHGHILEEIPLTALACHDTPGTPLNPRLDVCAKEALFEVYDT